MYVKRISLFLGGVIRQMSTGTRTPRGRLTDVVLMFTPNGSSTENYFDFPSPGVANTLPNNLSNSTMQQIVGIPGSLLHPPRDRKNRSRSQSDDAFRKV